MENLLSHNAETGELFWKERPVSDFKTEKAGKAWNTRFAGKPAFTATNGAGYKHGSVNGKFYLAHRVLWRLEYGEWPDVIDHINRDRSDNRISNLQSGTQGDNMLNAASYGQSEKRGVGRSNGRWVASFRGKYLGSFKCETAATSARLRAEKKSGMKLCATA